MGKQHSNRWYQEQTVILQDELLRLYVAGDLLGAFQLAQRHGYPFQYKCFARMINRWKHRVMTPVPIPPSVSQQFDPPLRVRRLADVSVDDIVPDIAHALKRGETRVMHLNDIHFPFHDLHALALTLQILADFQPDIVVIGSDEFDFPSISKFEPDPDVRIDDYMQNVEPLHSQLVNAIDQLAPNALIVFITGNHDVRAFKAIRDTATPTTLMHHFVNLIRCGGRVKWPGLVDHIDLGVLRVEHGDRATVHTAYGILNKHHRQQSVIAGHTHRPDFYSVTGRYQVHAVVSGCLCQLTPHYNYLKQASGWQHGTVLATIWRGAAHLQPVLYAHDGEAIYTKIGIMNYIVRKENER